VHDGKIGKALDGHGREMSYGTGKKEIIGPSVQAQGECVIPPAIPADALADFVLNAGGTEADRVRSYVEWQAPDETVKRGVTESLCKFAT